MADPIKFSELGNVGELSSSALVAIVQQQNGELVSLKCTTAEIAQLIVNGIEFSGLTSNDKKIIGAINEALAGGGGGGAGIDDDVIATDKTWSSSKIDSELGTVKSDLSELATKHINLIEGASYTDNVYWKRSYPADTSSSANIRAYAPFTIEQGKTYYVKNVWGYFCGIIYDGTTSMINLTNVSASQSYSGSFTATSNGKVYITSLMANQALFTDDEILYNRNSLDTFYTPNKLVVDTEENLFENLIDTVGTFPNQYLNGQGQDSSANGYTLVDYIKVVPNKTYYIKWVGQLFIAFYDSAKRHIIPLGWTARPIYNSGTLVTTSAITIPNDVEYVRIACLTANIDIVSLSKDITEEKVYHVGSTYPYPRFIDAVKEATSIMYGKIIVHKGIYDIYEEYGGASFFNNYVYSENNIGLVLKNNIEIIGSTDSVIKFNYEGNNTQVKKYFSVFNASENGFTLDNITCIAKNCRYLVHDERYTQNDFYYNKYHNCYFDLDNSNNPDGYSQCIGGGLGTNGYIEVSNCTFNSVGNNIIDVVSYHNSADSNAKSKVVITNNYFITGTARVSWYGSSTKITDMFVTNNSMLIAPIIRAENESATIQNVRLISWNNEIRTT